MLSSDLQGQYNEERTRWYGSFADMLNAAIDGIAPEGREVYVENGSRDASGSALEFSGTRSWAKSVKLARTGWKEGREAIQELRDRVYQQIATHIKVPRTVTSVYGGHVNVGAYLTGRPDCFFRREQTNVLRDGFPGKVLRIVVNTGARASVSNRAMIHRGAAAYALIDALEYSGHRCEVILASVAEQVVHGGLVSHFCMFKRAEDHADPDAMAFAFAHPSMHRRMIFSLREQIPGSSFRNHGGSVTSTEPADITIPSLDPSNASMWADPENVYGWILQNLRDLGVEITD